MKGVRSDDPAPRHDLVDQARGDEPGTRLPARNPGVVVERVIRRGSRAGVRVAVGAWVYRQAESWRSPRHDPPPGRQPVGTPSPRVKPDPARPVTAGLSLARSRTGRAAGA